MKIFTSDSMAGGVLALQHHDYDHPASGDPWDLDLRASILGARITDRMDDLKAEEVGDWLIEREHYGDLTGAVLWGREKSPAGRPQNAFGFAFPGIVVADDEVKTTFGRGGDVAVKVLRRPWESDPRLATLKTDYSPTMNRPPIGSIGYVIALQEESEQFEAFVSPQTQAALIAPWRGGEYEHGTIVFDLDEKGALDPLKNGRIQHHLRVTNAEGAWQPALNMSATGKKSPGGHGLAWWGNGGEVVGGVGKGIAAFLSFERGGPLHPGHPSRDRHRSGTNIEGEPEQPAHQSIEAYHYEDVKRDGPKEHGPDYPDVEPTDWPHLTHVYEGWCERKIHWRRWTTVPISRPVPFDPKPPFKLPPPGDPQPPVPKDLPGGGGDGPGTPTNPNAGSGSPSIFGYELALPSIAFVGTRHRDTQAGQGFYGGGGSDIASPFDPSEGGGIPVPPSGGSGQPPTTTAPFDLDNEQDVGPANELRGRARRRKAHDDETQGRAYSLSNEALERGGPAPLSFHAFSLPKVNAGGTWAYKSEPGQGHGQGTAESAATILGPGGLLGDGPDDQTEWIGDEYILVYNGNLGGTPAHLGMAEYDQLAGDWKNGWLFTLDDESGAFDVLMDFRDADGVARNGKFAIAGAVVGNSAGSTIGLGLHADITAADTGTTLLKVGEDAQVQFAAFAEKGSGYTYNLDLSKTAEAIRGATFELHLAIAAVGGGNATVVVVRNGSAGSTLLSLAPGAPTSGTTNVYVRAYFDGTNWRLLAADTSRA